jgi:hypothetical protein
VDEGYRPIGANEEKIKIAMCLNQRIKQRRSQYPYMRLAKRLSHEEAKNPAKSQVEVKLRN